MSKAELIDLLIQRDREIEESAPKHLNHLAHMTDKILDELGIASWEEVERRSDSQASSEYTLRFEKEDAARVAAGYPPLKLIGQTIQKTLDENPGITSDERDALYDFSDELFDLCKGMNLEDQKAKIILLMSDWSKKNIK